MGLRVRRQSRGINDYLPSIGGGQVSKSPSATIVAVVVAADHQRAGRFRCGCRPSQVHQHQLWRFSRSRVGHQEHRGSKSSQASSVLDSNTSTRTSARNQHNSHTDLRRTAVTVGRSQKRSSKRQAVAVSHAIGVSPLHQLRVR